MGVLYGVLAALCWGCGDFVITLLTRRVGSNRALSWTQIASLLLWLAMLPIAGVPSIGALWGTVLLAAALHVVGLKLTYRAFEIGTLSLVSPLASGFAVVTAVLALFFGKMPAALALAGAALLVVGIGFATAAQGDSGPRTLRGVPEAIGSALAFGGMFYLFDGISEKVGYVLPLVILKTLATVTFSLPHWREITTRVTADLKLWMLILGVAVFDTGAWLFYIFGLRTDFVAIVTAVASLFSVVTVLLAGVLLKERLKPLQWIGVAVILSGVLIVSLPH